MSTKNSYAWKPKKEVVNIYGSFMCNKYKLDEIYFELKSATDS